MAEAVKAEIRDVFGKGASRQLRRDNRTPAVVYGLGTEPTHVHFDAHEVYIAIRGKRGAQLQIELEGKVETVVVKDVQRNPLSRVIEHIDFVRVAE